MDKVTFTCDEISDSLKRLRERLSEIALLSQIIDPYFEGVVVARKTIPFVMVINEFVAHIYGQLSGLLFDSASRFYKTISICEIYAQIKQHGPKCCSLGARHEEKFNELENCILEFSSQYREKLKRYRDKHYAHIELQNSDAVKQDYEEIKTSWSEILTMIEVAKEFVNTMLLYWLDETSDFVETCYKDYQSKFWAIINLPDFSSPEAFM